MKNKEHKTLVRKYRGTLKELAKDITDLRYDALAELLLEICKNLESDSEKDVLRERLRLAANLKLASLNLFQVVIKIVEAWKICEKHLDDDLTK